VATGLQFKNSRFHSGLNATPAELRPIRPGARQTGIDPLPNDPTLDLGSVELMDRLRSSAGRFDWLSPRNPPYPAPAATERRRLMPTRCELLHICCPPRMPPFLARVGPALAWCKGGKHEATSRRWGH
jgi:hypothetical protein